MIARRGSVSSRHWVLSPSIASSIFVFFQEGLSSSKYLLSVSCSLIEYQIFNVGGDEKIEEVYWFLFCHGNGYARHCSEWIGYIECIIVIKSYSLL